MLSLDWPASWTRLKVLFSVRGVQWTHLRPRFPRGPKQACQCVVVTAAVVLSGHRLRAAVRLLVRRPLWRVVPGHHGHRAGRWRPPSGWDASGQSPVQDPAVSPLGGAAATQLEAANGEDQAALCWRRTMEHWILQKSSTGTTDWAYIETKARVDVCFCRWLQWFQPAGDGRARLTILWELTVAARHWPFLISAIMQLSLS